MRVLVLGGTGSIGGPVVRELIRHGHEVVALVRSDASARSVAQFGASQIVARAFARRFGTRQLEPEVISEDQIATELGDCARGYARDQRLSGNKARRRLGWEPKHLDPESEIVSS